VHAIAYDDGTNPDTHEVPTFRRLNPFPKKFMTCSLKTREAVPVRKSHQPQAHRLCRRQLNA
jgi:hypothetical protein